MLGAWNAVSTLDRMFDDVMGSAFGTATSNRTFNPAIDVRASDSEVALVCDVPGVKQEDLEITLSNRVLTIKGARRFDGAQQAEQVMLGRAYGSFSRSYTLPDALDEEKLAAELAIVGLGRGAWRRCGDRLRGGQRLVGRCPRYSGWVRRHFEVVAVGSGGGWRVLREGRQRPHERGQSGERNKIDGLEHDRIPSEKRPRHAVLAAGMNSRSFRRAWRTSNGERYGASRKKMEKRSRGQRRVALPPRIRISSATAEAWRARPTASRCRTWTSAWSPVTER